MVYGLDGTHDGTHRTHSVLILKAGVVAVLLLRQVVIF